MLITHGQECCGRDTLISRYIFIFRGMWALSLTRLSNNVQLHFTWTRIYNQSVVDVTRLYMSHDADSPLDAREPYRSQAWTTMSNYDNSKHLYNKVQYFNLIQKRILCTSTNVHLINFKSFFIKFWMWQRYFSKLQISVPQNHLN